MRTGYERVVASRVDRKFAAVADQSGRVLEVTPTSIIVEYKDGTQDAIPLGRDYGIAAGSTYPHTLETRLKTGDTFKPGDTLMYNAQYFEPDPLNPNIALWKAGTLSRIVMMESPDTLEDASAISEDLAKRLNTQITKVRDLVIPFDQNVHNLVSVGDSVEADSILCIIEDAVSARSGLFDDDSLDTLRMLAANSPKAKFKGTVECIEVFYHGDMNDMTESLQSVARRSDLERRRKAKSLNRKFTDGRVDDSLRINQNGLPIQNALIRIYITGDVSMSSGDL